MSDEIEFEVEPEIPEFSIDAATVLGPKGDKGDKGDKGNTGSQGPCSTGYLFM